MIFDQVLGISFVLLVSGLIISFFTRAYCVMNFYSKGFISITRSLHEKKSNLRAYHRCGRPVRMQLKLKGRVNGK
ncbi:MAG: hypothetical protein OXB84_08465 [Halobacteriovoraceae bacterium]|nr:hypothetical protein [Halobacteriovoraceae bacterium]